MIFDYFTISFKNLTKRKLRSWLTMLGIFIGVAAVVSLISLGDGLRAAVNAQFGISSTEVITVQAGGLTGYGPPGSGVVDPMTKKEIQAIEKLNTVERAIGRNIDTIKIEFDNKLIFGYATDIPDKDDRKFVYEQIELEPEVGRLLKDGDTGKVVLGYNFYTDSNEFRKEIVPGKTITINEKKFEVIGIAKKKGSFIFDNVIYMNKEDLEDIIDHNDEVDIIAVKIKDKSIMQKAKEDIEKTLRKERGVKEGEEDFEVSTPESALSTVNSVLTGVQIFVAMIASISILVGAVGIINTMTTSVLERKKQIGTMKAIGARNSDIFLQFFFESGILGLIGGGVGILIGVIIGYIGTVSINNFVGADASPQINFILIISALLGSFLIGSIAGIVPALKAAKENPVDALRG